MNVEHKTVLITGANRGIGQALVNEALRRETKRVHAGTRRPLQHPDQRVTPLTLDVTDVSQIRQAVDQVDALDVLINNAGIALYDDLSNFEALLAGQGVAVRGFDIPKALPEDAARGIFDGLLRGEHDIFPDPASMSIADAWRGSAAKALERQFAAFIQPSAA